MRFLPGKQNLRLLFGIFKESNGFAVTDYCYFCFLVMEDQFISSLRQLVEDPERKKFLLAVSGGMDSVAMTHLFHHFRLDFDMAHCNFHLREDESDRDMYFVMDLSLRYGCTLHIKEFYHHDFKSRKKKSVEMAARELRYEWFDTLSPHYDFIVTAHHANDNAETLLLHLARGTGLKGLTGIPPVNGKIIRPLLPFSSAMIGEYVSGRRLEYRNDRTNQSDEYHRNKIRHHVIPELEKVNPSFIRTVAKDIGVLTRQYLFYREYMDREKEKLIRRQGEKILIPLEGLRHSDHAELLLYEILSGYGFGSDTIARIMAGLRGAPGKQFFSASHLVVKDRESLILAPLREMKDAPVLFPDPGSMKEYGFEMQKITYTGSGSYETDTSVIYTDARKLKFPLTLRYWEKGDFFFPFGMNGKKKLSDFFNDRKIDRISKHSIPLLCCGDDIVWVVGYRADNRFRIEENKTKQFYKIKYYGISKPY